MICGYCEKEISYDRDVISFHLNEKCQEEAYKQYRRWLDADCGSVYAGQPVVSTAVQRSFVGCGYPMFVHTMAVINVDL